MLSSEVLTRKISGVKGSGGIGNSGISTASQAAQVLSQAEDATNLLKSGTPEQKWKAQSLLKKIMPKLRKYAAAGGRLE